MCVYLPTWYRSARLSSYTLAIDLLLWNSRKPKYHGLRWLPKRLSHQTHRGRLEIIGLNLKHKWDDWMNLHEWVNAYMVMLKYYARGHMLVFVVILSYCQLHLRSLFALLVKSVDVQLVSRKWTRTNKSTKSNRCHLFVRQQIQKKWNWHDEWYRITMQTDANIASKRAHSLTVACIHHVKI